MRYTAHKRVRVCGVQSLEQGIGTMVLHAENCIASNRRLVVGTWLASAACTVKQLLTRNRCAVRPPPQYSFPFPTIEWIIPTGRRHCSVRLLAPFSQSRSHGNVKQTSIVTSLYRYTKERPHAALVSSYPQRCSSRTSSTNIAEHPVQTASADIIVHNGLQRNA